MTGWGATVALSLLDALLIRPVLVSGQLAKAVVVAASAKKLTVPVAKGGVATESVTVAVQLVEAPAAKAGGLQLTVVTVGCLVTVTTKVPLLVLCALSRSEERRVGKEWGAAVAVG